MRLRVGRGDPNEKHRKSFRIQAEDLAEHGVLPRHLSGSIRLFTDARNRIVHGHATDDPSALRAIDSGLTLLRSIRAVPHEVNVVYHPGVPVYGEAKGTAERPGVKAVVLETTSPGGATKQLRVYPTTRTHFQKGRRVAWEWSFDHTWNESWYRDPDSNEIKYAWTSSAEFVGRHLDEL